MWRPGAQCPPEAPVEGGGGAVGERRIGALEHRVVNRVVLQEALWRDADARQALSVAPGRSVLVRRLRA